MPLNILPHTDNAVYWLNEFLQFSKFFRKNKNYFYRLLF